MEGARKPQHPQADGATANRCRLAVAPLPWRRRSAHNRTAGPLGCFEPGCDKARKITQRRDQLPIQKHREGQQQQPSPPPSASPSPPSSAATAATACLLAQPVPSAVCLSPAVAPTCDSSKAGRLLHLGTLIGGQAQVAHLRVACCTVDLARAAPGSCRGCCLRPLDTYHLQLVGCRC